MFAVPIPWIQGPVLSAAGAGAFSGAVVSAPVAWLVFVTAVALACAGLWLLTRPGNLPADGGAVLVPQSRVGSTGDVGVSVAFP